MEFQTKLLAKLFAKHHNWNVTATRFARPLPLKMLNDGLFDIYYRFESTDVFWSFVALICLRCFFVFCLITFVCFRCFLQETYSHLFLYPQRAHMRVSARHAAMQRHSFAHGAPPLRGPRAGALTVQMRSRSSSHCDKPVRPASVCHAYA